MSGFLLDTNVVSETTKARPAPKVIEFLVEQPDLWLPAMVVYELEFGLQLMSQGQRRDRIRAILSEFIMEYSDRILPLNRAAAEWAAQLRARAQLSGRTLDLGDALIAGTAKAHDLAVATRNVADFDYLGIAFSNPWGTP